MQIASKQASFGTEHGLSMRQHDHHPENDNNNEAQGITIIITGLVQSASEHKGTINIAFTDAITTSKSIQDQIETIGKEGTSRKRNNNNKSHCWTHDRTRKNNHISSSCNNKRTGHEDDATFSTRKGGSDKYCNAS